MKSDSSSAGSGEWVPESNDTERANWLSEFGGSVLTGEMRRHIKKSLFTAERSGKEPIHSLKVVNEYRGRCQQQGQAEIASLPPPHHKLPPHIPHFAGPFNSRPTKCGKANWDPDKLTHSPSLSTQ